jgi:hypothetical protein
MAKDARDATISRMHQDDTAHANLQSTQESFQVSGIRMPSIHDPLCNYSLSKLGVGKYATRALEGINLGFATDS